MDILIDKIRIKNFRALKDIEINLKPVTILVGANNSGKTTLLRALNSVLGITRSQINQDDLFVDKEGNKSSNEITIDVRIISVDKNGVQIKHFDSKWSAKLGIGIQTDDENEFFAFRTKYLFGIDDVPTISYYLFSNWDSEQLKDDEFKGMNQLRNNIKMFFIDAQRDILEDSKQRTSFFGKLVSQLDFGEKLDEMKQQITVLNNNAINESPVLKHLKEELKKLNQTTQTKGEGVSLNPFPKKLSDLHKGMKVYFQDAESDAFSMENHGMGTRSWASIITAGAFSSWQLQQIDKKIDKGEDTELLFPIFALEEPEAHLHPNAQRTLYKQLKGFKGQKIVSTHSPYIAGQAELDELRHFYKEGDASTVSEILFDSQDRVKIKELVHQIEVKGKTKVAYKEFNPQIINLKKIADKKLTEKDKRDLIREILLNRGELLFARALLLFEGVTEEVSLPHFYQKYFNRSPFEDGITLVSVGGKLHYSAFLKFAKFLKIPVFILSDGDDNTENEVKNQIIKVFENLHSVPLFVLPNGAAFEKFLIDSGFADEIVNSIDKVRGVEDFMSGYIADLNGENRKGGTIRNYETGAGFITALNDCMSENKTEFAEEIAEQIIATDKPIPPKIRELFEKISEQLNIKQSTDE